MNVYTKFGEEALVETGRLWAIHDGVITAISAENVSGRVVVRMTCVSRPDSPAKEVRLRFLDVCEVNLAWDSAFEFFSVDEYRALRLKSGLYYFSIDPYDARTPGPDARDGGVIVARGVEAEIELRP